MAARASASSSSASCWRRWAARCSARPISASTVLAATAIMNAGTEAQKQALLPAIAAGETIATLAFTEPNGRWDADGRRDDGDASGRKFRLDGVKSFVLDGHTADLIVVLARRRARGRRGLSFFTVRGRCAGPDAARAEGAGPDAQAGAARVQLGVEAELLGEEGGGAAPFARTMTQAAVCLANEMVGGAERLRAVGAGLRQPARAVRPRHRLVPVDEAQAGRHAGRCRAGEVGGLLPRPSAAAEDDAELPALASLAKACASEAYMQTAIHTIQIHGGIGFTWDNDTHLWFKRAKSSEVFLGDPA